MSDRAIAAGVASIPGPVTDANDDAWFMWQPFVAQGSSPTTRQQGTIHDFDSKAMRKILDGFNVAFVVENASAAHVIEFLWAFSLLTSIS